MKELEFIKSLSIKVFETNLALGYGQLAYFVHYRNNDYLCIGLKNADESKNFYVGDLCKFADHEIQHLLISEYKLEESNLWNGNFVGWLLKVITNNPHPINLGTAY
jgi:Zn-dependent peptidase ImmA (M78 family)